MNRTLTLKLLALSMLALVLIVALARIGWKVDERRATRDTAVAGIAAQYAEAQQFTGPVLWLECRETREKETRNCSRTVRPESLTGTGELAVSERYRGIYKARVYLASLRSEAAFAPAPLTFAKNQTLTGAYWVFGVSDPRGIKRIEVRDGNGATLVARPGTRGSPLANGFHIPVALEKLSTSQALVADIELAGTGGYEWVPVADANDFQLRSAWAHPSFSGRYLPETRSITPQGFAARWRVNAFAAGGDNVLDKATTHYGDEVPAQFAHSLGVSLVDPVDAYVQSDRAMRYGFLFVLLTLGGFFLFELLKRRTLHPLQYQLIGFAIVVFFLLLIALAEHIGFAAAYVIAAAACTTMIALYGRTLLASWKAAAMLAAGYAGLFAGLYQLLASEDHALLLGAWLTFIVLAATMYLTRRLDWSAVGRTVQPVAQPE